MTQNLRQDPVFITGYPRSGTTLLQGLLVAQEGFCSFPETHFFSVVERGLVDDQDLVSTKHLPEALRRVAAKCEMEVAPDDEAELYELAARQALTAKALFEFLVHRLLPGAPQNANFDWRWVEKTPTHANFMERIARLYPAAQFLHIMRHPVPAILSRRKNFPFNQNTPVEQLAREWKTLQNNVARFTRSNPGRIHVLRYEELVVDVAREMNAVSLFLGFTYDPARNASYNQSIRGITRPSEVWKQRDLSRPWRNTNDEYQDRLEHSQVEQIEAIIGETMRRCGYHPFLFQ